jgi:hypothetical protein
MLNSLKFRRRMSAIQNILGVILLGLVSSVCQAQYDPAGGEPGSKAVHKSSAEIVSWIQKAEVVRGWVDISDTSQGRADLGDVSDVYSNADRTIMSLGDGGSATIILEKPLTNSSGFDFAIFENGFPFTGGYFLELAFVEVSANGNDYFRFPAVSLVDTLVQKDNGSILDPTKLNNLAGKHQAEYGTGFNLDELSDTLGLLIDSVKYIRIIDVVGSLNDSFARFDSRGNKVNDPWPTPFNSAGFDLDAVAILGNALSVELVQKDVHVFPNPTTAGASIKTNLLFEEYHIYSSHGTLISYGRNQKQRIILPQISPGLYTLVFTTNDSTCIKRITVK